MTFKDFITQKIPDFEEVLDVNTLDELRGIWDSAQKSMKRADYCLEMQFKGSAGIDYTNDFEKNNAEASRKLAELNERIKELTAPQKNDEYENSFRF